MLYIWMAAVFLLFKVTNANSTTPPPNITQCGNLTCYHNSPCRHGSNGVDECMCRSGYFGNTCFNDSDECSIGHPCAHRGHCHNNFGSYRCDCLDGWSGGDVHCVIKDNSSTVHKCMPGWMGDWCQDNCLNDSMCRPTEICKLVGNPKDSEAKRGHQCRCAPGWDGVNCTIDLDECLSWRSQCPKKSICMNTPGSYKCPCLSGWTGDNCTEDIDECLVNPCQHSSTCANEQGSYNCTCAPGWRGDNCTEDIDECTSKPCSSVQKCFNTPGSFQCNCTQGWAGENCTDDIDECQTPPCLNSGTCINTNGSYDCNCTSGWQGDNCEDDINECDKNPCNGTSTCENYNGSFSCSGDNMSSKEKSDSRTTYIIVGAVLGSFLIVCSIVASVCIVKHKWNGRRIVAKTRFSAPGAAKEAK